MNNPHQEYVLHADGNFYKRTVLETVVCDQEEAMASIKTKPLFFVNKLTKSFTVESELTGGVKKYNMYSANHISPTGDSSVQLSFVEAPYFYFRGANLICRRRGEEFPEHYNLHIPYPSDSPLEESSTLKVKNANELEDQVRWQPSLDGLRLFFMFSHSKYPFNSSFSIQMQTSPYVFVYDPKTKQSYAPHLANVFDRGDICTGDTFPTYTSDFDDLKNDDLLGLIKKSMLHLNTSRCNNDLRADIQLEADNLKFDETGNSISVLTSEGVPSKSSFYQPINHDSILSFTTWLNQQA
jgi:hypothetical protein